MMKLTFVKTTNIAKIVLLIAMFALIQAPANAQKAELVVQTGHFLDVDSVAFSGDGKTLASGSSDGTIKLWNAASGKELKTLSGHSRSVWSVTFSPDGKTLASGSWDHTIKIWDAASGKELKTLSGHSDWVNSVAFSPDGKTLASGGKDHTIKIWDAASGKELKTLSGYSVNAVAFSPDGKTLASGSGNKTIKMWNTASGKELITFSGHSDRVSTVAFSPDGKTLVSGSWDKTTKLWDVQTGRELHTLSGHSDWVKAVAFSPDGKTLSSGGKDHTIKIWDAASGKELKTLLGHSGAVNAVAFSPDGKTLASGSYDRTIKIWDAASGTELNTLSGHSNWVGLVAFSPDGKTLASGSFDKTIKIWDAASGKELRTLSGYDSILNSVAFSPDGKTLASGSSDHTIKIWDAASGMELKTLSGHSSGVMSIAFSGNGLTLASGSMDKTIKIWDAASGKELKTLSGHSLNVGLVAFSPDGKTLASASYDNTIKLWDAASGKELKTLSGYPTEPTGYSTYHPPVAFSSDSKTLASGSRDKTIKIWDTASGKELKTLSGHSEWVGSLAFSTDGKTLASGSSDRTIRIWDAALGKELKTLPVYDPATKREIAKRFPKLYEEMYGAVSDKLIAEVVENVKIRVSDKQTGNELATLIALDKDDWVVIDPDGRFDASPGAEKLMHYVIGLEPIDLEQIKDRYYTPILLHRIWKGEDLDATRKVSVFTADELYPLAEYAPLNPGETVLSVRLKNRGGGIGPVQVFVNGAEILADARPKGFDPKSKTAKFDIDFSTAKTLKKGESNDIRVIARNEAGWLRSRGADIIYLDNGQKDETPQEFYAIIGGVSDYEGDFDLRYAAKDARDFAAAVELGAVKLFGRDKVHIRLLSSGADKDAPVLSGTDSKQLAPTKENFRLAFEEFRKARPSDVLVVYLAGHGTSINEGGDTGDTYLYLTQEAITTDKSRLLDEKLRESTTVSSEELAEWIREVPALKRAMILDTCAAGAVQASLVKPRDLSPDQVKALDRMKDRTGFYVLMGSAADAQSYEATRYGQGLLTYSLLQGMSGAKLRNGEFADVRTLFSYAEDRVVDMAKGIGGIQQPRIIAPTESRSFDIGQFTADEKSKFTLAKVKELILQPKFFNKQLNFDNIGLSTLLANALRNESSTTARGNEKAKLVFVDAVEMPDAITPAGPYEVSGDQIKLTLILVKNNNPVKTTIIEGTLKDKGALSQKIVKAIIENAESIEQSY